MKLLIVASWNNKEDRI